MSTGAASRGVSRRGILAAGVASLTAPYVFARSARASQQVICRNSGGDYDKAARRTIYDPFTKATGIEVIAVSTNQAQLAAMVEARRVEIDWAEISENVIPRIDGLGALAPIDYGRWRYSNPASILPRLKKERWVGQNISGTAITYSTREFSAATAPKDWAEFFDIAKFPQPRMMEALEARGIPELEVALLADGVPMDKVYPLDVPRAMRMYDRIKPKLRKLYRSGAESVQVMASGEALMCSMWNGRAQAAIDQGAPLAINWHQCMLGVTMVGILKDGPNPANAQLFMDFALQPAIQAAFAREIPYGPVNQEALRLMAPQDLAKLPNAPGRTIFYRDYGWWAQNTKPAVDAWQKWVLS